jgi:MFS family permease
MSAATGWSRTAISSAMTLDFVAMGITSFGWGMMMDRFGPRIVLLAGSSLLGVGLVAASRASTVEEFQFLYGVLVGAGGGAIFAPLMATVTGWFDRHRSLAVSLVSAGMGVAPVTVAPIAARLVSTYDWRFAQLLIGLSVWALLLPAAFLVRRAPSLVSGNAALRAAEPQMTVLAALTSRQFIVLALTYFLSCATHSGPLFHTVSYAISCGLSVTAAVSIYSVEGLAGLAGRIAFGLLGDRFGAKRTFVGGLLLQATAVACYYFAHDLAEFYSVAVVFGFAYAGVMPLYAVLVRENFPLPIIGTMVGAASMASSLGMALGPLAGGIIFDTYGTYGRLYVGACFLGLGAAIVMLTFKPAQAPAGKTRSSRSGVNATCILSGTSRQDVEDVPMLGLAELGLAGVVFLLEFEDVEAAQPVLDLGAGVKVHPAFGCVPAVVEAEKLPGKEPTRLYGTKQREEHGGELVAPDKGQRELGVDQVIGGDGVREILKTRQRKDHPVRRQLLRRLLRGRCGIERGDTRKPGRQQVLRGVEGAGSAIERVVLWRNERGGPHQERTRRVEAPRCDIGGEAFRSIALGLRRRHHALVVACRRLSRCATRCRGPDPISAPSG